MKIGGFRAIVFKQMWVAAVLYHILEYIAAAKCYQRKLWLEKSRICKATVKQCQISYVTRFCVLFGISLPPYLPMFRAILFCGTCLVR